MTPSTKCRTNLRLIAGCWSFPNLAMLAWFKFAVLAALSAHVVAQVPTQIGSSVDYSLVGIVNASLTREIKHPGASFLAVHFKAIDLPAGATLSLTSSTGEVVIVGNQDSNNYAEYVLGDSATVKYSAPAGSTNSSVAFSIDSFVAGTPEDGELEAVCGKDDSQPAVCIQESEPVAYERGQAVARLLIQGKFLCTGWLFGSEGHLMTNNHCIKDVQGAEKVQVEFQAECKKCDDPNNNKGSACKGKIVATSGDLVHTSPENDFTLIKLHLKPGVDLTPYGYLQARASGPVLDEEIYIAQHPAGKPKRFSFIVDDGSRGTITKMSMKSCKPDEVGYMLDTQGGSSGSPVLSVQDNAVVALHNCGGCNNGGIKINKVVAVLEANNVLPKDALFEPRDDDDEWTPLEQDVDFYGHDITSTSQQDAAQCKEDCNNTPGCAAFTWTSYNGGTCWLKDLPGDKHEFPGAISAVKLDVVSCGKVDVNTDLPGQDIDSTSQPYPASCCQDCRANPECASFVWTNYNGGTCWLKAANDERSPYDGAYAVTMWK